MKFSAWWLSMSGRRMVPLLLFAFALLVIGLRYGHQMSEIAHDVAERETSRLRERLSVDQARLDIRLGTEDRLVVRRLVSAMAVHEGVEQALLLDGQGRVQASLARRDLGLVFNAVVQERGLQDSLGHWLSAPPPRALEVLPVAGGSALAAAVPLQDGHRLLVWQDLSRSLALRRVAVQREVAYEALLVLGAVSVLALMLHGLWFRRARLLAQTLASIGSGDLSVRSRLQGRDELAHIGAAADRMAEQLQHDQGQLRHLHALVNRSPLVVIEWRNQAGWPVQYVSDSVALWGYEPADLLHGKVQYSDLIHPDEVYRIHREVERYFAHGPDTYRQEYRIRRADGGWAWVDDRTSLTRDEQGQVQGISGVLLDITAQKEAEQAQREQGELLRMFYDLPFLGMAISSPADKRWLQVNDRLCEILGYSRDELLRMTWAEMTPPGDLERNVALFDELLAGKRDGYRMSKRFVRKDGCIVHTEIDVRALRHADGRVRQLFATIQDVTERKAADDALQRSQQLLLKSQQIGRMGSWTQDLVSGLFSWSPQTHVIHETDPAGPPLTLDFILGLLHPDDVARVAMVYGECQKAGQPYDIRYRLRMADGRIKHLHVRGEFEFEGGQPVRSVGMVLDETDLVQAQRERDRLVSVLETTSDIVSMADPQGRVFYFNRAGYEMLGLPVGTPLDDVIRRVHPGWAAQLVHEEGIPAAIRNGRWLGETAVFDAAGREVPMSQLIMSHRGADGQVDYLWSILRDISERKAIEAALERERAQLADAQAVAHVGSWIIQLPEENLIWSDEHYRVLGLDPQRVTPSLEAFLSVVHPEDLPWVRERVEQDLQRRTPGVNRFEHRILTAQGVRHVEERADVELDAQGRVFRIVGTTMDITERVDAAQALLEAKDMLEQAESVSLLGSWAGDVETQRLTVSDQLFRNLGLEPSGRPPSDDAYLARIHPDDRAAVVQDMASIRGGGPARELVFRTHPDHGPMRWLRRTARRITREAEGLKPRYIGTLQDITDVVQAEERLRRANQELEQRVAERTAQLSQANQELEAFSYTVSHDLKAPLRGIDGYSQLLVEEFGEKLGNEGSEFVRRIRHGVELMGELINDLLAYSRMERRDMARDPVALLPLVQQVLEGYEADIRRMGVQVQMDLPPVTLALDREGMAVVLRNLIGNAIKFSRDRQPPRLDIGSRREAGRLTLWVRDNGVGFDMKYHDRMFGIFQRLHRAEEFPGTGVGLALVAKAVQRMGGRVWAESTLGSGSTFFLEFPE